MSTASYGQRRDVHSMLAVAWFLCGSCSNHEQSPGEEEKEIVIAGASGDCLPPSAGVVTGLDATSEALQKADRERTSSFSFDGEPPYVAPRDATTVQEQAARTEGAAFQARLEYAKQTFHSSRRGNNKVRVSSAHCMVQDVQTLKLYCQQQNAWAGRSWDAPGPAGLTEARSKCLNATYKIEASLSCSRPVSEDQHQPPYAPVDRNAFQVQMAFDTSTDKLAFEAATLLQGLRKGAVISTSVSRSWVDIDGHWTLLTTGIPTVVYVPSDDCRGDGAQEHSTLP